MMIAQLQLWPREYSYTSATLPDRPGRERTIAELCEILNTSSPMTRETFEELAKDLGVELP